MTYNLEILINAPLESCINKFYAKENLKHWQRNFVHAEHLHGTPGQFGSKTKMHFKIRNKNLAVVETIMHLDLPFEWHGLYTTDAMDNLQKNYFEAVSDHQTRWRTVNEISPLNHKMWFLVSVMPNSFKKQSLQYMKDFKNFAENDISVNYAKSKINMGF